MHRRIFTASTSFTFAVDLSTIIVKKNISLLLLMIRKSFFLLCLETHVDLKQLS
jgi:hypothetical protein